MKFIYSIILFFILSICNYSHPHVFFDTNINIKIENKKLEGIELQLNLDELNTRLNKKILKPDKDMNVEQENIVFLKYLFKHIRVKYNNKTYKDDDIIFEQAKLEDDSLEIYFFIPIDEKIDKNSKLKIALYDTKYYYNYDYDKSSLKIDKDDKTNIKAKVNFFTNNKIKFYFNLVSPNEYEVSFE
ncbi:DUF1007 family protein [Fusobacterium simiae]|uniref:DUF1007 family protein n=1 Tax=Fusobacterium simiae TaxID=855 RepID=A0ABT4DET6_FUSSI|nr:DUF1007 family protein [Fusobacterium simiae]MCY7007108.1 DUF1007 family protein [Fusobacterium simiae]